MSNLIYPKQPEFTTTVRATTSGAITLSEVLTPGLYLITTDSAQTWNATLKSSENFAAIGTLTSGVGYISIPFDADTIIVPTGLSSYNFNITLEKTNYNLTPAPTFTSFTFTSVSGLYRLGTLVFSNVPAGATSLGYFDNYGNFWDIGSVPSSPSTSRTYAGAVSNGQTGKIILVAKDAKGIWGQGMRGVTSVVSGSTTFSKTVTTTESWTPPAGVTSISLLAVGGGGNGGNSQYAWGGGGGGAGGYLSSPAASVTPGIPGLLTVGAGGGGNSGVGSTIAYGGGNGGFSSSGGAGGSGGGAAKYGGPGSPQASGGAGVAGQGYPGSPFPSGSQSSSHAGGGAAGAASGNTPGGAVFNSTYSLTYSGGGKGDFNGQPGSPTYNPSTFAGRGMAGDGGQYYGPGGSAGSSGTLIISYTV
jgi:hypothetical protein